MLATRADARDLCETLAGLYRSQLEATGPDPYLEEHAAPEYVKHHVNVFLWYSQYLPETGAILDWGCHHAPDACLLRKAFGGRYDLHGCDFPPESEFRAFHEYSNVRYETLTAAVGLPYAEHAFDVVIGSGVLEHTAMDQEALKALFHVLKPEGVLIISSLPYRLSWHEWYRRRVLKDGFHRRLYGKREADTLLKRCGFYPMALDYQTFVPNVVEGKLPTWWKRALAPVRHPVFSHSTLCCAARKMTIM